MSREKKTLFSAPVILISLLALLGLSALVQAAGSNLLSDPGFENWSGSDDEYWTEGDAPSKIHSSTIQKRSGDDSCRFQDPTADYVNRTVRSAAVAVTALKKYTFGGWFYVDEEGLVSGTIAEHDFKCSIEWYTSGDVFISRYPDTTFNVSDWNVLEWEDLRVLQPAWSKREAPATAAKAKLFIKGKEDRAVNHDLYVDDAYIYSDNMPTNGSVSVSLDTGDKMWANKQYTFTTTYTDGDGYDDIQYVLFLINSSVDASNCFYGYYNLNNDHFYICNDAGDTWIDCGDKDSMTTRYNSYAYLENGSTASVGGDTLTVTWKVRTKWNWDDRACNSYLYVKDDDNNISGWSVNKQTVNVDNDLDISGFATDPADGNWSTSPTVTLEGNLYYEGTAIVPPDCAQNPAGNGDNYIGVRVYAYEDTVQQASYDDTYYPAGGFSFVDNADTEASHIWSARACKYENGTGWTEIKASGNSTVGYDVTPPTTQEGTTYWTESPSSDYLHVDGSTLYFSLLMGSSAQAATISSTEIFDALSLVDYASFTSWGDTSPGNDTDGPPYEATYNVDNANEDSATLYISATDNAGNTGSNLITFTTVKDITAPTNVGCSTPADNAQDQLTDITLTCLDATDAGANLHLTPYYFELDTVTTFDSVNFQASEWQGTSWAPPTTLDLNTTYYWRVQAKDNVENKSAQCGHTADEAGYGTFTTAAVVHPVISEIQTNGGGASPATDEFIELYNPTNTDIDISNWSIQEVATATDAYKKKDIGSGTVPAKGYFLVAHNDYVSEGISAELSYNEFNLPAAGATVFLVNDQVQIADPDTDPNIVDKVAYGTGDHPEGTAFTQEPSADNSIERKLGCPLGSGTDSGDNSSDFKSQTTISNPQNRFCPVVSSVSPDEGGAGIEITIIGENFTNDPSVSAVELWTTPTDSHYSCEEESYSTSTEMTAKIPSGLNVETTYYVVVENPDGQKNSPDTTFGGTGAAETKISITKWRELY